MFTGIWKNKGPGKVVESLSPEERQALSQLKSEELASVQDAGDCVEPDPYREHEAQLKREFDKKLIVLTPVRKKYEQ